MASGPTYAARSATTSTGTASLKLNRDPLGSQFLNDLADAAARARKLKPSNHLVQLRSSGCLAAEIGSLSRSLRSSRAIDLDLRALESPGLSEAVAAIFFDDVR